MTVRYSVAAVFAAAIAAVLILRHEGYLHGRVTPGPLRLHGQGTSVALKPGQTRVFGLQIALDGAPVRVESVKPDYASPRLEIFGPRHAPLTCNGCARDSWPPRYAGRRLPGRDVSPGHSGAIFALRATAPGIYHVHDLTTLYKRGAKGFSSTLGGNWCVTVGKHLQCATRYVPPPHTTIAEWGGPSRYHVPVRATDVPSQPAVATYPAQPGATTISLTLSNLSRIKRTVTDVHGSLGDGGLKIAIRQPDRAGTTIAPHEGRRFLLDVAISGCRPGPQTSFSVDRLKADVDGRSTTVPLSVALAFQTVSAC